ncbi:MAG TPA: hypothetical protein VJT71_09205 [Pyrinomonadaceae bacterium]|nr:hypothetical protein [Pyrinomonadaceae bacterium]
MYFLPNGEGPVDRIALTRNVKYLSLQPSSVMKDEPERRLKHSSFVSARFVMRA